MAHDVFISYSSKDKTIADAVCARLEARGIRCWIAPRDVQPGLPYGEEIIDGIHHSRAMVLVLSSNANASPHIPKEIERAVSHGIPIIPLRVENVMPAKSLDYFISSVHWLDAITPPLEQHLENLANTIRTLLPEAPRPIPVPPAPVPTPIPVPTPVPRPAAEKPKWLLPGIVVAVLVFAGLGWFFMGRTSDSTGGSSVSPVPPASHPTTGHSLLPSTGADPLVGCWHWFNNVQVAINPDGTMIAGPYTAHWRVADSARRTYHFTWPPAVDTATLSPDGATLSGGNQYGFAMSATRLSPGPSISGFWRWYNGVIVTVRPDGIFTVGNITGHWQTTPQGTFTLTWPDPTDSVTLSSDRQHLSGKNQYGIHVSATKTGACPGT